MFNDITVYYSELTKAIAQDCNVKISDTKNKISQIS